MAEPEKRTNRSDVRSVDTGWTVIARNDSVVQIVDSLLDMTPEREFNKSELARFTSVSRKSVHAHLDLLLQLDLLEAVPETSPQRYRFNPASDVAAALIQLDGAVNNAGPGFET